MTLKKSKVNRVSIAGLDFACLGSVCLVQRNVGEEIDKNKDKFKYEFLASVYFTSLGGENYSDQRADAFAKPQSCTEQSKFIQSCTEQSRIV